MKVVAPWPTFTCQDGEGGITRHTPVFNPEVPHDFFCGQCGLWIKLVDKQFRLMLPGIPCS